MFSCCEHISRTSHESSVAGYTQVCRLACCSQITDFSRIVCSRLTKLARKGRPFFKKFLKLAPSEFMTTKMRWYEHLRSFFKKVSETCRFRSYNYDDELARTQRPFFKKAPEISDFGIYDYDDGTGRTQRPHFFKNRSWKLRFQNFRLPPRRLSNLFPINVHYFPRPVLFFPNRRGSFLGPNFTTAVLAINRRPSNAFFGPWLRSRRARPVRKIRRKRVINEGAIR